MAAIIEGIVSAIMEIVGGLVEAIAEIVEALFKGVVDAAEAFGELLSGAGKALFSGFESVAGFLSNLSMPSLPLINLDFIAHVFGRKVDVNLFQLDASDLLKDQTVSLIMQRLKVTQPQQSLATVLCVGGKAGVNAGFRNYERTGNLNKAIEVARNEAAIKASGQAIREIPNLADAGSPAVNYVQGRICDKAANVAEHELRRELSNK